MDKSDEAFWTLIIVLVGLVVGALFFDELNTPYYFVVMEVEGEADVEIKDMYIDGDSYLFSLSLPLELKIRVFESVRIKDVIESYYEDGLLINEEHEIDVMFSLDSLLDNDGFAKIQLKKCNITITLKEYPEG